MNIGIIGVGKLGLVYALAFEKNGATVYASSYKKEYVEQLQQRITDTLEPNVAELLSDAKNITFTIDNHEVIRKCDVIYLMVATPSNPEGDYDVAAVQQVVDDLKAHPHNVNGKILIVGCTVNPGDCARMQSQIKNLGIDVVYCPTFAAQGSVVRDVQNPPGILFGTERQDLADRCQQVFDIISPKDTFMMRTQTTTAEILKMSMNCYSTMRISFYNQIGQILIQSGMQEDLEAAGKYLNLIDSKKGSLRFGFGFGGPCFPRDNRAFSVYANKLGNPYEFGPMIDNFNRQHSIFLANWLKEDNTQNLPYYFDHITYKPGVALMEESRQYETCCALLESGHKVYINCSRFLPDRIQETLKDKYADLVEFVNIRELAVLGVEVYHIKL
jgi:nucleotide sugar dehydrogenase